MQNFKQTDARNINISETNISSIVRKGQYKRMAGCSPTYLLISPISLTDSSHSMTRSTRRRKFFALSLDILCCALGGGIFTR
jgi:hypothetical protein